MIYFQVTLEIKYCTKLHIWFYKMNKYGKSYPENVITVDITAMSFYQFSRLLCFFNTLFWYYSGLYIRNWIT